MYMYGRRMDEQGRKRGVKGHDQSRVGARQTQCKTDESDGQIFWKNDGNTSLKTHHSLS